MDALAQDKERWWGFLECGPEPPGSTKFGEFLD